MERIFTPGLIYRLIKYTDSSAIALAFTRDFGKLKLFMPKAYTKKSGIMTLVPGEMDFLKKDNSDLNKLYGFRHDPAFMAFVEEPAVSLRLSLIFDVFDNIYETEQKEPALWTMITRFNKENASSALIYTFYVMLKNSGLMFNRGFCSACGKETRGGAALAGGLYYCRDCAPDVSLKIGYGEDLILRALGRPELYRNIKISGAQEAGVLDILICHTEAAVGGRLKSYGAFKALISSL